MQPMSRSEARGEKRRKKFCRFWTPTLELVRTSSGKEADAAISLVTKHRASGEEYAID